MMAQRLTNVEILQEFETPVRGPQGVCRFVTIIGSLRDLAISGGAGGTETFTCLVGPVLKAYEFMGASSLPSIVSLRVSKTEISQCSLESSVTEWDENSGQVELRLQLWAAGPAATASILFSVTILAAG